MIEMSLKTITGVMIGLIMIILMEGMIFGVYMNHINNNKATQWTPQTCVMYCAEQSDGTYDLYIHDVENGSWQVKQDVEKANITTDGFKDVIWRAPNAFDVSVKGVHYVVMAVFIVAILGFYGWRFYRIDKEYKGFEKKLKKTGNIFA